MPLLRVHFLPEWVDPAELAGGRAVVVDVLRATTTIVSALAAGARAVRPCLAVDEARRLAATLPPGEAVLGGERGGLAIEGFDLGNSPAEFTPQRVAGKTVVLTTTNGTKALAHCHAAEEILIGAFVNLSALCAHLIQGARGGDDVDLVCAGTELQVTRDDVLVAGAVAAKLGAVEDWRFDDQAEIACAAWLAAAGSAGGGELSARLASALRDTRGGRHLLDIGMADDLLWAAQLDRYAIVPRFEASSGRIEVPARGRAG